jgi:alpha-L-rhamnosidase
MSNPVFRLDDLRSNARINPLGTDNTAPRFSWKLVASDSAYRGLRQTAYRVCVATCEELLESTPDLWDSGEVVSDQSVDVPYAGALLGSETRAYWTVTVTNETGESVTSASAFWETGLLEKSEWQPAQWIAGGLVGGKRVDVPLPYLRRVFTLDNVPENVRLNITALGLYQVYINGVRVGEDELTPGWTDYTKRVQYQTYEVSSLLRTGENVIAAVLGDGWYCGHIAWCGRECYGERPKLIATLRANGDTIVATDTEWKVAYGALLEADLLMGETYDARRERDGWNNTGFVETADWQPVTLVEVPDSIALSAMVGPTVKATQELTAIAEPQTRRRWPKNEYIWDFGQNLV